MIEFVWMCHPNTGGVQKFAKQAVPAWREAGWEPCEPPAEPNLALATRPPKPSRADSAVAPTSATPEPEQDQSDTKPATRTRRPSGANAEE